MSPSSSSSRSGRTVVPEAKGALNQMKYEIASELGINLKQGYNGDLTSRDAGSIGGMMVKKMIEAQEQQMAGSASAPSIACTGQRPSGRCSGQSPVHVGAICA